MRSVPSRVLAPAALAVALAVIAPRAFAQNTNPSSVIGTITPSSLNPNCPVGGVSAPPSLTPLTLSCTGNSTSPAFTMTASGQATAGPASSVSANATFSGFLPNTFVDANTQSAMFEYFTFTGPVSQIFKIVVTANATVSSGSQDPDLGFRTDGTLDLGAVDIFGQAIGVLPGGEDVLLPTDASRTLTATFLGSNLNGLNILYFSLYARAEVAGDVGPVNLDPIAFASLTIDNPQIAFYDANNTDISGSFSVAYDPGPAPTSVPEPASLTLLATGFASVAGVVRRKRRAALGSN